MELRGKKVIVTGGVRGLGRAMVDQLVRNEAADVLINNAGILYSKSLIKITPEGVVRHDPTMWNKVLAADLSSVFYMSSCLVEKMVTTRTKGVIVNISSVSANGNAGQSA